MVARQEHTFVVALIAVATALAATFVTMWMRDPAPLHMSTFQFTDEPPTPFCSYLVDPTLPDQVVVLVVFPTYLPEPPTNGIRIHAHAASGGIVAEGRTDDQRCESLRVPGAGTYEFQADATRTHANGTREDWSSRGVEFTFNGTAPAWTTLGLVEFTRVTCGDVEAQPSCPGRA